MVGIEAEKDNIEYFEVKFTLSFIYFMLVCMYCVHCLYGLVYVGSTCVGVNARVWDIARKQLRVCSSEILFSEDRFLH